MTASAAAYRATCGKTNNDFPSKPNKYHINRQQDVESMKFCSTLA